MTDEEKQFNLAVRKGIRLFTEEQRDLLNQQKESIRSCLSMIDPNDEETSHHEIMLFAMCHAINALSIFEQNLYFARTLFTSNQQLADQLHISRQTLTKRLTKIKQTIKSNAETIMDIYSH